MFNKSKKFFAVVMATSLMISASMTSYAEGFKDANVENINEVSKLEVLNYHYVVEYFMDTKKETYTYIENATPVTVVFNSSKGKITSMFEYNGDKLESTITTNDLTANDEMSTFNFGMARAYSNRKFSRYSLADSYTGNRHVDRVTTGAIAAALLLLAGQYVASAKIMSWASLTTTTALGLGYTSTMGMKLKYRVKKYWSNTTDGIDPVIYKTKMKYYTSCAKGALPSETQVMYTYNNPI